MDNHDLINKIYDFKKMRENFEPVSFMARKAYEGKHFVYWNRDTKQLVDIPMKRNTYFNQLPEISTQTDKFENFLLTTNFTFTVVPKFLSDDEAATASMYLSSLARDYYKKLRLKKKLSPLIKNALFDNVSYIETSLNDMGSDVETKVWDFFEMLFNPTIRDWDKQKLVVKVIRKKIKDIENSKLYTLPDKYYTGELFFSWKDIYESQKYASFVDIHKDETLLFECFIIQDDGSLKIKTIDGAGNTFRDDDYPTIKSIPIKPFSIYSGDLYQPSFVYRLIPINRQIDIISKRIEEMLLRVTKGGYLVQEEESINGSMNDEIGQIIRYSGTKPEPITMGTIPPFILDWFGKMFDLSERYGMPSILAGNLPEKASGLRANAMIESMVSQAYQNNSATIENLRYVITETLKDTFSFLYEIWQTPQEMTVSDLPSKLQQLKFISAKYAQMYQGQGDMVQIPQEFDRFDIEVDNAMGYTLEAQKETALELSKIVDPVTQQPLISGDTLKRIFKLGASGYLMEADETPMHQTPEFQNLIKMFPNMNPQQKDSMMTMLQTLSSMQKGNGTLPPSPAASVPGEKPAPTAPSPISTSDLPNLPVREIIPQ